MRARLLRAVMALVPFVGCTSSRDPSDDSSHEFRPAVSSVAAATTATMQALTPLPGPCELLPVSEIAKRTGPLDGAPVRDGNGCWFYVVSDTTTAEWHRAQAGAERARSSGMDARAIALYHPTRAGIYAEVDVLGDGQATTGTHANGGTGWDDVRVSPTGALFSGRAGYVRVTVKSQLLRLAADTLAAIGAALRDRIPDAPIPHAAADHSGRASSGRDPCTVLSRADAEAVLGRPVAPPFRTRERTPLADPAGASCAYLTAGHRVLVLTPVWGYAGLELNATRMISDAVRQMVAQPGVAADTLEGKFDEAVVDLAGELLFRRGGRGLGVRYQMSSTNAAGAIRIAELALARLAALPDSQE